MSIAAATASDEDTASEDDAEGDLEEERVGRRRKGGESKGRGEQEEAEEEEEEEEVAVFSERGVRRKRSVALDRLHSVTEESGEHIGGMWCW